MRRDRGLLSWPLCRGSVPSFLPVLSKDTEKHNKVLWSRPPSLALIPGLFNRLVQSVSDFTFFCFCNPITVIMICCGSKIKVEKKEKKSYILMHFTCRGGLESSEFSCKRRFCCVRVRGKAKKVTKRSRWRKCEYKNDCYIKAAAAAAAGSICVKQEHFKWTKKWEK